MVNFRIFAEVSANGSDPGPCSALRDDRRRAGSPGERPVALAGEGRRTAHKSGCTHLAAGVGVSRGHPKGLFLVDTGLPRTVSPTGVEDRAAQLRMFGRGWYTLVHSVVAPGQSIGEQLAARGIRPQDLDYVLFSHLDPDHIAGISEVRGAKRLLVPEEEYFWSCRVNLRYTSRRLWIDEPPERFWYRVNHIGPESRSYDLFGDDSVHLVHIAGHTEGMFAALIRNGERYVLLNADGAASPRSWAEGTVPGICENSVRAKKALDWIGSMSRDPACVASLCSHDPDIAPQTIEF